MVFLMLLHAIFAATYTLGKVGLWYAQPIFFAGSRALISGILLLAYHYLIQKPHYIQKKHLWLLVQFALFQIFFAFIPEYAVIQYINSAKWSLIYSLCPFITALFLYFFLNEIMTKKKVAGLIIGFLGLMPVLLVNALHEEIGFSFWLFSLPELAILASVTSFAYSWVLAWRLIIQAGYPVALINGISMTIGGSLVLATSLLIDNWTPMPITAFWPFVYALIAIVASTILAANVNTYLLKWYTAPFLLFLGFLDPLYVALYGWLFLQETVQRYFFVGVAAIFIGLYIFWQEELQQEYQKQPS